MCHHLQYAFAQVNRDRRQPVSTLQGFRKWFATCGPRTNVKHCFVLWLWRLQLNEGNWSQSGWAEWQHILTNVPKLKRTKCASEFRSVSSCGYTFVKAECRGDTDGSKVSYHDHHISFETYSVVFWSVQTSVLVQLLLPTERKGCGRARSPADSCTFLPLGCSTIVLEFIQNTTLSFTPFSKKPPMQKTVQWNLSCFLA
jgi:hypothetical protein